MFFPTVPSANTLVRWVNESAFVSIVQTRPCPTFGRPVHLRGSPHRLRPGSSPHAFRIPSHDGHPALRRTNFILRPARHYPRFWIWPSSSECQKDFNLPEQRAAQHTSGRRRRACALASVRRSNCTYGFPVCSFHEDCFRADAIEGISPTRLTSPYSPYSLAVRQLFPAAIPPTFEPMRPDASSDPTVELVEELSDVGALVVLAPTPQNRIQLGNQLRGCARARDAWSAAAPDP